MARGRRCDSGCETWPTDDRYKFCFLCGEKTTLYKKVKPITVEEANEIEFEQFYKRWDEQMPASRLDPDGANAAGRFRSVKGLIAASAQPPTTHRLSPPG